MTNYIYARVSTDGQSCDSQVLALKQRYPDAVVVTETASGAKQRPELEALLARLAAGDQLIVAALDRLGRKTSDVLRLIESLAPRGIILISVREGVDYATPVGRLITQILVSVAEMERSLIIERIKAGMKAAKAKGKKIGKRPVIDPVFIDGALELLAQGHSSRAVARLTGISYAYLNELRRSGWQAA